MKNILKIDLSKFEEDIPRSIKKFDPSYVTRYVIACKIINALEQQAGKKLKILDVGGYNGAARVLLPDHHITILDVIPDDKDKNYIRYGGGKMPFESNSFDLVLSCDTLEHIKPSERNEFVREIGRVSGEYLVLCAPFDTEGVAEAELRCDTFYRGLTNEESYIWLKEHRQYGLPSPTWFENILRDAGFTFANFTHSSCDLWEVMLRTSFFMAGNIQPVNSRLASRLYRSNDKYLKECTFYDFPQKGYRSFYIGSKHSSISVNLPTYSRSRIEGFLLDQLHLTGACIQQLTSEIGAKRDALDAAGAELHRLESENNSLKHQISSILNSKAYKVAQGIRNIKHIGESNQ